MNKRLLTLIGSILVVGGIAQAKEVVAAPMTVSESTLEARVMALEEARIKDGFEFHGYFRTGSDGNFSNSFKKIGDRNKNLIGRWGNEYDSYTAFNFSKKFYMDNGAWARTFVELDNWNNNYKISSDINLAAATIQMGNIPVFTGAFKDSVVTAGKQGWGNRAVDMTDYFYQDMDGVGLGLDGVRLGEGKFGLAYITSDANDGIDKYYRPSVDTGESYEEVKDSIKTSDNVRAARATYEIKDFTLEMVYAHAADNDEFIISGNDEDVYSREASNNGFYTGLYYNPQSFYGMKGWGQHFVQYGTGILAGSGLGRLDTPGNFLAHKDSNAFQIGTNGGTNLTEKLSVMTALRYQMVTDLDAREFNVNDAANIVKSDKIQDLSELGFSVRPVYSVNNYFDLWLEAGVAKVERELYNGDNHDNFIWKISAGPQLKLNFGSAETSVRAYVTYYNEEEKKTGKATSESDDVIGGFQMSVWW